MKKIVSLVLSVVLVFALGFTMASSAALDFSYDKETLTLNIGGTLGTSEHQPCMVYIYDAADSTGDLSDLNPPVFADVVVTGAGGSFEYSKVLTDTYSSGKYRVTVSSPEATQSTEFMYTNKSSVTSLLPLINGAQSSTALEGVITPNATALGIDTAVYNPIKIDVCTFTYFAKPATGFADADAFINAFDQSLAAAQIKNGADASAVLKAYAKALSIDYENDYGKFDSNIKSAINAELRAADYTSATLSAQYPELRVVAFMKAAPTWQALKNAFYGTDTSGNTIVSNYSVITPDLTVFNTVTNKDDVFGAMFRDRATLTSVQNIRQTFMNCCLEVYNSEQSGGQSTGGGGGGGVSSGPVAIDPGYVNQGTTPPKANLFDDVAYTDWYFSSVEKLVVANLINGYEDNTFRPENPITRAEYTKLIVGVADYLAIELDTVASDGSFADVASADWYADVVTRAALAGLVTGNEGNFNPQDNITRQDASVILYRLVSKVKAITGDKTFTDDSAISDYAKEAVSSLAEANIISGMGDGTFAPTQNLTRAQAAKLLCSVLEYLS